MCKQCRCTHTLNKHEKNRLIHIILEFNIVDKNVLFLHIPGVKIAQIKIPRNVVDEFGKLTA
jgi:hypothetical protein